MLNLEWFTKHNFVESYKAAKTKKAMLVFKPSQHVMADFGDRKNKVANPVIEIYNSENGELLIVSRIANFEHELRQLSQDVSITLMCDKTVIGKLSKISELWG